MRTRKYMPMLFLFAILFSLLAMPIHADAAAKFKFTNIKISEANFPDKNLRAEMKTADKNKNGYLSWSEFHNAYYSSAEGWNFYGTDLDKEIENTKGLELLPFDIISLNNYNGGSLTTKNMPSTLERLFLHTARTKGNYKISLPSLDLLDIQVVNDGWKYTEKNGYRIDRCTGVTSKAIYDVSGCKKMTCFGANKVSVAGMNQCPNLEVVDLEAVTNTGKLNLSGLKKLRRFELIVYSKYAEVNLDTGRAEKQVLYPIYLTGIDISGTKRLESLDIWYGRQETKPNVVVNKKYKKYFERYPDENDYELTEVSYSDETKEGRFANANVKFK